MPVDTIALPDRLRVEGVNCLGYGIIPKYAMLDHDLSITAKAIYAYFCSLSGNGSTSFPAKETVQAHLKLGNEAYYKHREMLIQQGYLRIEKQTVKNHKFSQNLYTLVSNPKKFEDKPPDDTWKSSVYGLITTSGLKAAGYGQIPRAVMYDLRLDAKAKAVYAYFASYAGAGRTAFPSAPNILKDLGISQSTYLKAMKALQELGLIEVRQRNGTSKGKRGFSVNDYYLIEKPGASPYPKNPYTVKPYEEKPKTERPHTEKTPAENPNAEKPHDNINTPPAKNISSAIINPSEYQQVPDGSIDIEANLSKEYFEEVIRESIFYDDIPLLAPRIDMKLVDNLVSIMAAACVGKGSVKIGREDIPKQQVREVFTHLEGEHLIYAIECVQKQTTKIRNIRAYYLTTLFRASETCDAYYANMVAKDMESPEWGNSL